MATPTSTAIRLPLFPLQTVLFPDGHLPLRVFEVRYLDMIGRCHEAGTPFGVVCLTRGQEVRQPRLLESFHMVGTLAGIVSLERPQQGLIMVRCVGGRRFSLRAREQLRHGLWMGEADLLDDDLAVPVPHDLLHVAQALQQLVHNLEKRPSGLHDMALQTPYRWDDCGWLANRWCELLPISSEIKQRCMSLDNPLLRLELVADLLERLGIRALP